MFIPAQCTEREPDGDEDCTWCSGVMLNNAAHGKNKAPSTRKEYEALRVAGGDGPAENPGDGSNLGQLEVGIVKRYDWRPVREGPPGEAHPSFTKLWNDLKPGRGAAVQGSMKVFSRAGHWRRWDRQFGGAHCVYVQRLDDSDTVWWMNPSAPNSYPGERMSKAAFKNYYEGFDGGYMLAEVGQLDGGNEPVPSFTFIYDDNHHPIVADLAFNDPAARWLRLADNKLLPVNINWTDKVGVKVRLLKPIISGKPETDFWMLGWMMGDNAAFVLDRNVVATPIPVGATPAPDVGVVAVSFDGARYQGTVNKE